jgi:hypothetical protein
VLIAVKLNDQLPGRAVEIDDKPANRLLPSEPKPLNLAGTKNGPQDSLGFRRFRAQVSRKRLLQFTSSQPERMLQRHGIPLPEKRCAFFDPPSGGG